MIVGAAYATLRAFAPAAPAVVMFVLRPVFRDPLNPLENDLILTSRDVPRGQTWSGTWSTTTLWTLMYRPRGPGGIR